MNRSKEFLKNLLKNIKTIALVGASSNPRRDSYKVMKYLIDKNYEVLPVNPKEANKKILGRKCFSSLNDIQVRIDMIDIFLAKEFVMDITNDAIKMGVDVVWAQEGIVDDKSFKIAKKAGIIFIMDECPKKVLED